MKRLSAMAIGSLILALFAISGMAQTTGEPSPPSAPQSDRDRSDVERTPAPAEGQGRESDPRTGGDTRPNAVDPAEATTTGANVGDGASYSRSTEEGQSTLR